MLKDLVLDQKYKNVAVKLSGGADSAIVYYAVCDYYKNKNTNIYACTMDTALKPWYTTGAAKIIKIVGELTGVYPVEHLKFYNSSHTATSGPDAYATGIDMMDSDAVTRFNLNAIYSGLTINPPLDDMKDYFKIHATDHNLNLFSLMEHIDDRDTSRDTTEEPTFLTKKYNDQLVDRIRPFINKDKKDVATAYKIYDMTEHLYPHTYSCESVTASKTFTHCGHCFFCLERYYGFGRII